MQRARYARQWLTLWPARIPEQGSVTLNSAGLAVLLGGRYRGDLDQHACPARVKACKYCRESVRVLHQPPGSAERLAVVDARPRADGMVVVGEDGYARPDPDGVIAGERYRWHTRHGQTARDVRSPMTQRPAGAR